MLIVWVFLHIKSLPNLLFRVLCLPGDQSHLFAQPTINSCVLHLLGWFIGSRGFSSLERRPEFWVLQQDFHIINLIIFLYTHTFPFIKNRQSVLWNFKSLNNYSMLMFNCCRKGDPFQGMKVGSCLTLGNELSEETHVLTERFYWEAASGQRATG